MVNVYRKYCLGYTVTNQQNCLSLSWSAWFSWAKRCYVNKNRQKTNIAFLKKDLGCSAKVLEALSCQVIQQANNIKQITGKLNIEMKRQKIFVSSVTILGKGGREEIESLWNLECCNTLWCDARVILSFTQKGIMKCVSTDKPLSSLHPYTNRLNVTKSL